MSSETDDDDDDGDGDDDVADETNDYKQESLFVSHERNETRGVLFTILFIQSNLLNQCQVNALPILSLISKLVKIIHPIKK
jgi:hypothetical protein